MALAADAHRRLAGRIIRFDDPATPYVSRQIAEKTTYAGDYDHLARVREWSASGWADDEE